MMKRQKREKPKRKTSDKSIDSESAEENEIGLSSLEMRMIRSSWKNARKHGYNEPGRSILMAIFNKEPKIQQVFETVGKRKKPEPDQLIAACMEDPDLEENIRKYSSGSASRMKKIEISADKFISHAERFTRLMDLILENLETPSKLDPLLRFHGQRHARLIPEGISSQHWDVFGEAIVEKSLDWGQIGMKVSRSSLTVDAWCRVALFLTYKMKAAYEDAIRQRKTGVDLNWNVVGSGAATQAPRRRRQKPDSLKVNRSQSMSEVGDESPPPPDPIVCY